MAGVYYIGNECPKVLIIDPSKREILIPKSERVFGVYGEGGVEKKHFKCPRIIGGNVDLSDCYIFINYISSGGKYGQYLCEDVAPTNDGCVTFTWSLTPNVFDENKNATIYFSVQAKRPDEDGELVEVFRTRMAQGKSYETVHSEDKIVEQHADVIMQILCKIDKLEKGAEITTEEFEKALAEYVTENSLAQHIKTDETLKVTEDGRLAVNTTNEMAENNTLPITSAGVQVQVGNINALLETI